MLNEQGNILTEDIPITKELLDYAKANNYKISLKTGDYRKEPIPTTRGQRYNKELISVVHRPYYTGNLYLTDYFEVFGFSKLEGLMQAIKQCGFKLLTRKETQELYGEQIQMRTAGTNMHFYGYKAPTQNPDVVELGRQTCLRKFEVDNFFKSAKFKEQRRVTMLDRYKVEHNMQNPECRAKAMTTWKNNFELEEGVWITSIPAVRDSINSSLLESCGAESFVQSEKFRDIMDQKDPRFSKIREFKDDPCADPAEIIDYVTGNYSPSQARVYLKELGIKQPTNYLTEVKLCNFLESIGIEYIHNAKKDHQVRKHNGEYYELDVYIPALKLGIEINGLAFHSANFSRYGEPKTKDYHFEKFKAFHSSGILVLSFTDYEQDFFTEDYINIIKHHLTGEPLNVSKEFLEFNQISNIEESLNYGLFDPSRFTGNFEDHQHQRFIKKFEYWDCGVIRQLNVDSY
nr:MAG TPA: endonuclease-like protein [Caudoviricetes sp.]